eukprot:TRINITY_DN55197_c0_g1_i2.p1 TRINITY_DN55197_c0_g1~~TRINITY_DN55197_c0_g1_i2.p1  ORF type:complete len:191 (+),score=37.91 TRINITY_DN55197_c0_g1_i2:342-914(+)
MTVMPAIFFAFLRLFDLAAIWFPQSDLRLSKVTQTCSANQTANTMTSRRRRSSMEIAALDGDLGQVVELIKSGADMNAKDDGGRTPLHNAVFGGQANIAAILLKNGADPEVTTEDGRTAMLCCAHSASAETAQVLLEAKANINALDKSGLSTLDLCIRSGSNTDSLEKLLKTNGCEVHSVLAKAMMNDSA